MLYYERKLKKQGFDIIIGVDEVGRGPLAGPLVAAAVNLTQGRFKNRIDDSKKLTSKQRERAYLEIIEKSIFGISIINETIIDSLDIQRVNCLAMEDAVSHLIDKLKNNRAINQRKNKIHILVDGNIKLNLDYPVRNIINGDAKSKSIASASIIAKVTRDRIMYLYDKVYPDYGFVKHKGYPTRIHKDRLKALGPSQIHRKSFSYV